MADANGIIFKNPTLNTWFIAPTVDLTAWNVITVSDCTEPAFNLEYTYVPATAKWTNGIRSIWKDTLWYMSDGVTTYTAPDNGLNIPPATFYRTLDYPLTVTVSGDSFEKELQYYSMLGSRPRYVSEDDDGLSYQINKDKSVWEFVFEANLIWENPSDAYLPPKTDGWISLDGGDPITIEYTLEATATVSPTSSTVIWVSNNPITGFVSLTDTPDEDFGYVITFDVQGGTAYPYYKYCTKGAGEVYGTLPEPTRGGFILAGWYTAPEGQGTRVTATDTLAVSADDTLYARWIEYATGKVGCGSMLLTMFCLGIGTDFFCERVAQSMVTSGPRQIIRSIPSAQ